MDKLLLPRRHLSKGILLRNLLLILMALMWKNIH